MKKQYVIPASTHRIEEVIKGSRFITTVSQASTIDEAKNFIANIKKEFSDATHNCWAYQTGPPGDTASIGMSDDGEPPKTAGMPMLNVLIHFKAGEIVAVISRYFGGVKLGTGGLVRAYSGVLKNALASIKLVERIVPAHLNFAVNYKNLPAVNSIFKNFGAEVTKEEYKENAIFSVTIRKETKKDFKKVLINITKGDIKFK
mmetsp:Transcript_25003/g.11916  ORF Transcript_25003/g.11916 Transcript_25003/m.11916 type:complete len:202 (+) Transcript_25003:531-1136(+)